MVLTLEQAGQVSVPMSSILDALEGVLTDAERTKLFESLVGLRPSGVAPGDLITAELFNQVLADLNDLSQRVAALEGESDQVPHIPVITQIVPQFVTTGQKFTVFGKHLNAALLSRIDIAGSNLSLEKIDKPASSPTRLVIEAPAVMTLPSGGDWVVIQVSNAAGTGTGKYFQLPGKSTHLEANLVALLKTVTPAGGLKTNQSADLTFGLTIFTSMDEKFLVSAQFDNPSWKAEVKGDATVNALADSEKGFAATKVVTIKPGTGTALLTLGIDGTNFKDFSTAALATPLNLVDVPQPATDKITCNKIQPVTPKAQNVLGTVQIKRQPAGGATHFNINFDFVFQQGGLHEISAPVMKGKYAAEVVGVRTGMNPSGPGAADNWAFKLTPENNGQSYTATDGELSFTVTCKATPSIKLVVTVPLKVVENLPQP